MALIHMVNDVEIREHLFRIWVKGEDSSRAPIWKAIVPLMLFYHNRERGHKTALGSEPSFQA